MPDTVTLTLTEAESLVAGAFAANGVPQVAAASVARALVAAEAEGQSGHGFSRISDYIAQARSGKVSANATPQLIEAAPGSVVIDAGHGFAYPALELAVTEVTARASKLGSAVASVRRSHHCGALSVQVDRIAQAGCVGIMMANSPPAIAPWGAAEPLYGTNPIAFAAPRPDGRTLVIDLSLSRVARGKVMHAKKTGQPIPEGWALDSEGRPTTDPEAGLAGSMVPIGEAKGTSLAMMVEILTAVFTGANLSSEASSFFSAEGPPPGTGQFLMALQPPDGVAAFHARIERLLALVEGAEGARLPGSRRIAALERARVHGIDVPTGYVEAVRALAGADV